MLAEDPRFSAFQITARGDGFVEVRVGDGGVVLVEAKLWRDPAALEPHLIRSQSGSTLLLLLGSDPEFAGVETLRDRADLAAVSLPLSRARLYVTLKNYVDLVILRSRAHEKSRWADRYQYELGELIAISRAIASERDIYKLLGLILEKSRYITGADAGSVYIVEGQALNPRERTLRSWSRRTIRSRSTSASSRLPIDDKSIVGRAVISRQVINIPDLYDLSSEGKNPWGFVHDKKFDRKSGYEGRSMLTVPMINQRDEVIGVIQLINRRRRRDGAPKLRAPKDFTEWVLPFDKRSEELIATLASQAGISLENTLLYEDIRKLFEGFVNASVTAIESRIQRRPAIRYRVATLTVGLAETVDKVSAGPYEGVHFYRR